MPEVNGHNTKTKNTRAQTYHPSPDASHLNPVDFVHAFRRRYLVCIPLGLIVAVAAAAAAWYARAPKYEATALLKLYATNTELVFDDVEGAGDFAIFQGTQKELVKSRFVMTAALRDPDVAQLSVIRREDRPVDWLMDNVSVSIPKNTEIMRISLRTDNPTEAIALVNAVVDAYENEVLNFEQQRRQQRLNEVEQVVTEKETELRRKRNDLKRLAAQLGSGDSEALSVKQQMMLQSLGGLRTQLIAVQSELWRAEGELKAAKARLESEDGQQLSPRALESAVGSDTIYRQLLMDKMTAMRLQSEAEAAFKGGKEKTYRKLQSAVDRQVDSRLAEIKSELGVLAPLTNRAAVAELETQSNIHREIEERIQADMDQLETEIDQIGNRSIDVEMMRGEIQQLAGVLDVIALEREQLKVEARSKPRVSVLMDAEQATLANLNTRIGMAALAAMLGFFVPVAIVLSKDVFSNHVNSSSDVTQRAGLDVIGSIPLIPAQAVRQGNAGGQQRFQRWQALLSESMSRVATKLLIRADAGGPHVIFVTSAVASEGKTTLATQLAMSLARAGRSVVLADLDLRQASVHRVFGRESAPGICEVLRGDVDLANTLQPTDTDNLTVIAAGECDRRALRMLGHESTASLFKEIRTLADFVIVDGCPVLPLADTGFICPHVDAVLFAIRRDVSQVNRVRAAQDFISHCGVDILGAVVTESNRGDYKTNQRYVSEVSA